MKKDSAIATTPKHIAIIMDGNRRYAKKNKMPLFKGHEAGANKIKELFDWCKEYKIKEVTLYTFSIQNFNREKSEIDYLLTLFEQYFKKIINDAKINENKIKINFIGRLELFPAKIQQMAKELMDKTKNNQNYTVNFAFGYGGREEIIDAVKKIAEQVKFGNLSINEINENIIKQALYLQSEPEIIIRTSGEKRTSNFLIWQSNYSEWFFSEKFWPEFSKKDFAAILEEYKQRERRYGK